MIISDLNYLETVSEASAIVGGKTKKKNSGKKGLKALFVGAAAGSIRGRGNQAAAQSQVAVPVTVINGNSNDVDNDIDQDQDLDQDIDSSNNDTFVL